MTTESKNIIRGNKIKEFIDCRKNDREHYSFITSLFLGFIPPISFEEIMEYFRPSLFRLCFIKLFKNACPNEINTIINKNFMDLPYKIIKIRDYSLIRGKPKYLSELLDHFSFNCDWQRPRWITGEQYVCPD